MAASNTKYVIPEGAPVLPSLASVCECEFVVKDDGLTAVFYSKPLAEEIEWVEYDEDLALLTFVTWSGKVMGLGMKIHEPFREDLKKAEDIMLIYMEDGVTPRQIVPAKLVTRCTGV
ncbi:MAG: hypothetical protein JNN09_01675 [Alphaproteobacteria bacterium]|jgi:hypothetical protein|nr:hypothetical protein [Alphaproteobacteria bacterium]